MPAKPAYPFLLALVLAFQLLAGAFSTGVSDPVRAVCHGRLVGARAAFEREEQPQSTADASRGRLSHARRVARRAGARAGRFRWPRSSSCRQRGWPSWPAASANFEYLSGFASPPFHLVNYVAPGLFHRSPLWRPLVWDPFHAMPEEHLTYVGLVPLFLACMTVVRECRRDPNVRLLVVSLPGHSVIESRAIRAGLSLLDHASRFLVLQGPVALERGHGAGAGSPGGEGDSIALASGVVPGARSVGWPWFRSAGWRRPS